MLYLCILSFSSYHSEFASRDRYQLASAAIFQSTRTQSGLKETTEFPAGKHKIVVARTHLASTIGPTWVEGIIAAGGSVACILRRRDISLPGRLSSSVNATEVSGGMKEKRKPDETRAGERRLGEGERISHFYITFPAQQRSLHPRPVALTWQALPSREKWVFRVCVCVCVSFRLGAT